VRDSNPRSYLHNPLPFQDNAIDHSANLPYFLYETFYSKFLNAILSFTVTTFKALNRNYKTFIKKSLNLAIGEGFEPSKDAINNLSGFQDQCIQPNSASLPYWLLHQIKLRSTATTCESLSREFIPTFAKETLLFWGEIRDSNP
jgi:hypothetical protein